MQQILQREGVSPSNIRTKLSDEEQIGVIKRLLEGEKEKEAWTV